MTWWIWIIFGLLLLAAEVMVPGGIIMLFFGAAALIVGLLVALGLGGPIWLQWALFSVVSVVSLLALRTSLPFAAPSARPSFGVLRGRPRTSVSSR